MNDRGPFRNLARAIAFGRRVPLAKIARRIELDVKRRVARHAGADRRLDGAAPPLSNCPPLPLFPPRHGKLELRGEHLRFTFLEHCRDIAATLDWSVGSKKPRSQLWRMNLHYMEYLEEVDDGLFADLVLQWIDGNPPYVPGYWQDSWNSYALSLRVVVWMQQFAARADRLDKATRAAMITSIAQQIRFLKANLETDIGGNHLVKNIKTLIWASAVFTGVEAERWRALGLRLMRDELPRQIFPDGMHYERSPSYHCQVFADLLECRHALGVDPLDGALDDALARMGRAAADLAHPDGGVALFNDAGLSMAYAPQECIDVYERLFGSRPAPRRVFALADAGYFGLRAGPVYFVADCGRIAPDDLPAHGHGDVLGFELSVAGLRIIVDQGVFEYVAGERRGTARAAASHNTLCLDGADQADFFGAFRCGARPNVTLRAYESTTDGFRLEGAHDGFARLPGAPIHRRRFSVDPAEIVIEDRLDGCADRPASIGFLLHPETRVDVSGVVARIARGDAEIEMTCTAPIEIEDAVWWPDMGCEIATKRLRVRVAAGVGDIVTRLRVSSHWTVSEDRRSV
jgi:uncharacterized heparinase superfamily protein